MFYYKIKPCDTIYKLSIRFNVPATAIISANPGLNPNNLKIGQCIEIPGEAKAPGYDSQTIILNGISQKELKLRENLRELWEEHVAWTRMTIISAASDSPDLNLVATRLLRNADDMAAALKPLYGESAASKFGQLIRDHLSIAMQLVTAAKQGNTQDAQTAEKQWYVNADQIAVFLNSINPYIDADTFRKMLYMHLALTKKEAVERLNQEYAKDIDTYDLIESQALDMADLMADGIVKQFPDVYQNRES